MALAAYLVHRRSYRELKGLLVPFVIALVPVGLILREPDLGTSLVFLPVLFAMLFAAGARVRHLVFVVLLAVPVLPMMWMGMSGSRSRESSRCSCSATAAQPPPATGITSTSPSR